MCRMQKLIPHLLQAVDDAVTHSNLVMQALYRQVLFLLFAS